MNPCINAYAEPSIFPEADADSPDVEYWRLAASTMAAVANKYVQACEPEVTTHDGNIILSLHFAIGRGDNVTAAFEQITQLLRR